MMENQLLFRLILLALIIGFIAHRGYYSRKHAPSDENTLKKREEGLASWFAGIFGLIGFIAVLVYVVHPEWIEFASIPAPLWLRWMGVGIVLAGVGLLQWAQSTLGKNWSDTPRMMNDQKLVTNGPYQWIRHPIYSAFILILGASLFISANWLIGMAWIGMTLLEIASRTDFEESIMLEYFGREYQEYMKQTGRLLPKLGKCPGARFVSARKQLSGRVKRHVLRKDTVIKDIR